MLECIVTREGSDHADFLRFYSGPIALVMVLGLAQAVCVSAHGQSYWNAPDRGKKVAALIPGRKIPRLTPETLFAEWTRRQIERWRKDHPSLLPEEAYATYAVAAPTDTELTAEFPVHIAPFGRVRSGKPDEAKAETVMKTYCPFCQSSSFGLAFDDAKPFDHATTTCCHTELYADEKDFPSDYQLKPDSTARFLHLDEKCLEVPCTLYHDKDGVVWELFIGTIFDHKRWVDQGCELVRQLGKKFQETADPLCAHKIAVILDKVADTYYGLPLCVGNRPCLGRDGEPLTRAEWEAVPRPAAFDVSYLGQQNRRLPFQSKGSLTRYDEHIWVEPFARVRHHPAFKQVSRKLHGDPEALDRKIMTKLLREISLMFQSVYEQKLLLDYQRTSFTEPGYQIKDLWWLGLLLQDKVLIDFTGSAQQVTMYNHTYQDGLNGEGAPNYMDMPGSSLYEYLRNPKGWLKLYPDFLEDHPFYKAAAGEMRKLLTVRGLQFEFGDQQEFAFQQHPQRTFSTDPSTVRKAERIGSRNWAGYGVGILRVGGPGHRQEVCLSYTRATLHNAQDALSLECWVDGVPVMRKGGYAAWWSSASLHWDRPEYQALRGMYPRGIVEPERSFNGWSWIWVHSPQAQNTVTVDEMATGKGWNDNRGYGECITFKGGEEAGTAGSGFQVLDVRDHYSWARVGKDVSKFRRTIIGVEGPDGRPYVLDLLRLTGGQRHALYNSAWAERAQDKLPKVIGNADDLTDVFFGGKIPKDTPHYRNFAQVRKLERLAEPAQTYDLTWKADYAAYAPRPADGRAHKRPIPENVGRVRLRFIGLRQPDKATELLRGKGPWLGRMGQQLANKQQVSGYVGFMDACDFLVEYRRAAAADQKLDSSFVHVLEGYREGEESAIRSVEPLEAISIAGPARKIIALRLEMAGGHIDTVVYQSEAGTARLPDGTQTDARYALLRRSADGTLIAADACRGTMIKSSAFNFTMPGDFTGTIVDVVGDVTGTRQQSALVIKPERPWPTGDELRGRQLLVRVESSLRAPCNEGYRVEKVTKQPEGLVRVELQDYAPFVVSWHQVTELPADRSNVIRTWHPMVDHGNTPWYNGLKIWFPERDKMYTMKKVNAVMGGYGGESVEVVENVSLAAEGIRIGDWYVIYGIRPGLHVTVANDFSWRTSR